MLRLKAIVFGFFNVNGELDVLVHLQEISYSRVTWKHTTKSYFSRYG